MNISFFDTKGSWMRVISNQNYASGFNEVAFEMFNGGIIKKYNYTNSVKAEKWSTIKYKYLLMAQKSTI